ncbi:MAG TPA: FHA domain-containing protein [Reyranella sp.]|nr:FHA domain-containing protein [Reyranella sp.]
MGMEILGLLGLSSVFGLIGLVLAGWMAWRIVEKSGLPGWAGLGAILLTLTGIGTIVPLILLWVFAFMRWPRDEIASAALGASARPLSPTALPPPPAALADRRAWRLSGLSAGGPVALSMDGTLPTYLLTGGAAQQANELAVPDPTVGQPHARLFVSGGRLGLEDLGTSGGTRIDGARLLPEHGPRDISAARVVHVGTVELALSRA